MIIPSRGENLRQQSNDTEKVRLRVVDRKLCKDGSRITVNPVLGIEQLG